MVTLLLDSPANADKEFLRHMRHELRTPLNAIIGYSELLIEDATDAGDERLLPGLETLRRSGHQLLGLINEILDASKVENAATVNVKLVAQWVRDALEEPVREVVETCAGLEEVAQLQERASYLPELEKISAAAARLWTMSRDIEAARKNPDEEPVPVGDVLPSVSVPDILQADGDAADTSPGTKNGAILVVDDNATNRDVLGKRLQREGYHVAAAQDGENALEMLQNQTFDLVLLDILMPGLDGYQVLEQLKADAELRHIPVIMISALHEMDSVIRCIEIGAEDYLPKPFNPILLKARVGACLEKKRLRDREMQLFDELQRNYEQLQQLEQLRDNLTHMVVHDLRTPLTSMTFGLQLIERAGPLNDKQSQCLKMALSGGENLLSMINDLLDISKMEDGSLLLELGPLNVSTLVESALIGLREVIANAGQTLEIDVPADLPVFYGDEEKMRRVLVNLLSNAQKFTSRGGRVKLWIRREDAMMLFRVSDTGEGIPEEAFGRIFEKFGQVADRKAGRKMSTGLGLPLVGF